MNLAERIRPILSKPLWTPKNIKDLKNWLVSDNPQNTKSGNALTYIIDKSGTGTHATPYQSSVSKAGLLEASAPNGRTIWKTSSGYDAQYSVAVSGGIARNVGGLTLALVYKRDALSAGDVSVFRVNTGETGTTYARAMVGLEYMPTSTTQYALYSGGRRLDGDSWQGVTSSNEFLLNDWAVIVACFDYTAAKLTMSINGIEITEPTFHTAGAIPNTAPTSIGIGYSGSGGGHARGSFAETLIANSTADAATRQKIEGYLAHEWGLQDKLPSGHPYRNSKPTL